MMMSPVAMTPTFPSASPRTCSTSARTFIEPAAECPCPCECPFALEAGEGECEWGCPFAPEWLWEWGTEEEEECAWASARRGVASLAWPLPCEWEWE
jgi:hypothetical protein